MRNLVRAVNVFVGDARTFALAFFFRIISISSYLESPKKPRRTDAIQSSIAQLRLRIRKVLSPQRH